MWKILLITPSFSPNLPSFFFFLSLFLQKLKKFIHKGKSYPLFFPPLFNKKIALYTHAFGGKFACFLRPFYI